jgi:hypothetical protein
MKPYVYRLTFSVSFVLLAGCAGGSTTPISSGFDATPQSILTNPFVGSARRAP